MNTWHAKVGTAPLQRRGAPAHTPAPKLERRSCTLLPFSNRSGVPVPHKKERRSSCRSFIVLDVYKKPNVILLLRAQQIKSKKSIAGPSLPKTAVAFDTRHYKLGMNNFKCED